MYRYTKPGSTLVSLKDPLVAVTAVAVWPSTFMVADSTGFPLTSRTHPWIVPTSSILVVVSSASINSPSTSTNNPNNTWMIYFFFIFIPPYDWDSGMFFQVFCILHNQFLIFLFLPYFSSQTIKFS